MLNNKYRSLSSLEENSLYQKSRQVCSHCKGSGKILSKEESLFYKGVTEYYYQKCPHCQQRQ